MNFGLGLDKGSSIPCCNADLHLVDGGQEGNKEGLIRAAVLNKGGISIEILAEPSLSIRNNEAGANFAGLEAQSNGDVL